MRQMFSQATCGVLLGFMLLALGQAPPAHAQSNLLTNGSFEVDVDGKALPDGPTTSDWRVVASVVGGVGSATVRSTAASLGNVGVEIAHTSGNFWFDRWDSGASGINKPGVYMLLVDAKNGGIFGSQDNFIFEACMHYASQGRYPEFPTTCVPGANFETFGLTAPLEAQPDAAIDVRLTPSTTKNQSFFADNIQVLDVTNTNRIVNGGFENSATRLLNWRLFSAAADEFTASLSSDAKSGTHAVLISRTGVTADGALDQYGNCAAVLPGEHMQVSVQAKKVSGDAATRLCVMVAEFDAAGVWTGLQSVSFVNPDATYSQFVTNQLTMSPNTTSVSVGLRVGDNAGGVIHAGSYLIDDVDMRRSNNLLPNGDFEGQAEGDTAINYWRVPWPSIVGITARAAAASEGRMGAEIASTANAGNFIDRWTTFATPVSKPGIYKLLIDAKNGGVYGSQDYLQFFACIHDAPYPLYGTTIVPGSAFETFGLTAPVAADRTGIDVRIVPSNTVNQSFLADNIQVLDVTNTNRVINGGFENSASRLVNWRAYSLADGEFLYSLSSDAYSGAQALRIERTAMTTDGAVDLELDRISVIAGETLQVSLAAKKLSGDAQTRLFVSIAQYDAGGNYLGGALQTNVAYDAPETYGIFKTLVTMDAATAYINLGVRVGNDSGGDRRIGAYLVDDLAVQRNQAPVFNSAALLANADNTSLKVVTSGWSDPNGDAEQYTYQWKLNGTPISGATGPALDSGVYGNSGAVTCAVTATDGINAGLTHETAPVLIPVELSSFSAE